MDSPGFAIARLAATEKAETQVIPEKRLLIGLRGGCEHFQGGLVMGHGLIEIPCQSIHLTPDVQNPRSQITERLRYRGAVLSQRASLGNMA